MKKFSFAIIVVLSIIMSASCSKYEAPVVIYDATVTFKPLEGGFYYLKQDDSTALIVTNKDMQKYPFADGKEHRAIVRYTLDGGSSQMTIPGFASTKTVVLHDMDALYTKAPVVLKKLNPEIYGDGLLGLYLGPNTFPRTLVEDGYLNVCFEMPMSDFGITHEINLLTGVDPKDPYVVELRHNPKGDISTHSQSFIINFPLECLPDTKGETVALKLRWHSMTTGKWETVAFDYCSRTDW